MAENKKKSAPQIQSTVQDSEKDEFMSRMGRWGDRSRSNWSWEKRPPHRNLTVGASLAQEKLLNKNAQDMSALEQVEESMSAMNIFLSGGQQQEKVHVVSPRGSVLSDAVSDMLKIKETSKQKAIEHLAAIATEEEKRKAAEELERSKRPSSAVLRPPVKVFDGDMLESVRRHNEFRQKMLEARKKNLQLEKEAMNFHALPLPGHVSASEMEVEDDSRHKQADMEMDSLSQLVSKSAPPKVSSAPAGPAFFITEGDNGLAENDQSEDSDSSEGLSGDSSREQLETRNQSRTGQALPISSMPSTARSKLSDKMDSARSARTERSGRAPLTQRSEYSESGILDLDQMERQTLWMIKKHKKQMEMQKKIELEAVKDLQLAPNISKAQESWKKAKEEHKMESIRQKQHEDMKLKIAEMQEQMHIMRLEQKVQELRRVTEDTILQEKIRGIVGGGSASVAEASASAKTKKRRKRSRLLTGEEGQSQSTIGGSRSSLGGESTVIEDGSTTLVQDSVVDSNKFRPSALIQAGKGKVSSTAKRPPRPRKGDAGKNLTSTNGDIASSSAHNLSVEAASNSFMDGSALDLLSQNSTSDLGFSSIANGNNSDFNIPKFDSRDHKDSESSSEPKYNLLRPGSGSNRRAPRSISNLSMAPSPSPFAGLESNDSPAFRGNASVGQSIYDNSVEINNDSKNIDSFNARDISSRSLQRNPNSRQGDSRYVLASQIDRGITYEDTDAYEQQLNSVDKDPQDPGSPSAKYINEDAQYSKRHYINDRSGTPTIKTPQKSSQVDDTHYRSISGMSPSKSKRPTESRTVSPYAVDQTTILDSHIKRDKSSRPNSSSNSRMTAIGVDNLQEQDPKYNMPTYRPSSGSRVGNVTVDHSIRPYLTDNYEHNLISRSPDKVDRLNRKGQSSAVLLSPKSPRTKGVDLASSLMDSSRGDNSTQEVYSRDNHQYLGQSKLRPNNNNMNVKMSNYEPSVTRTSLEGNWTSGVDKKKSERSSLNSSRAANDLYLSDSDSVVSYDANGLIYSRDSADETQQSFNFSARRPALDFSAKENSESSYRNSDYSNNSALEYRSKGSSLPIEDSQNSFSNNKNAPSFLKVTQNIEVEAVTASDKIAVPPKPIVNIRADSLQLTDTGKFFDSSSTQDKGRFRVNDARDFHTKSLNRKPDPLNDGVTLLLGVRRTAATNLSSGKAPSFGNGIAESGSFVSSELDGPEEVITVLFDRSQFTEDRARAWWQLNRERILNYSSFNSM